MWKKVILMILLNSPLIAASASLYPVSVQREVDLMHSLFTQTNKVFDNLLVSSMVTNVRARSISFEQVSFYFFYPERSLVLPGHCEMTKPHSIDIRDGLAVRRATKGDEVPTSYIRLFDPRRKSIAAELRVLVKIFAGSVESDVRYEHKVVSFIYVDGWKIAND